MCSASEEASKLDVGIDDKQAGERVSPAKVVSGGPLPPESDALYEARKQIYPQSINGTFRRIKWAILAVMFVVTNVLLFFFGVISTMVSPTTLPVDLPISANKTKEKPQVGVRIDADQHFSVNNELIDPLDLEGVLKDRMAAVEGEKNLVIHVDQSVPAGVTAGVMEIAKRNQWKVILATRPK